jgi:AGCS family alanine or glycine:cation symporter
VNRGLFSNEAGQGSAPIAHAAAKTKEPVSEGMVSILEPFIDTIIICTITGLVILSSGVWNEKHENIFDRSDMFFVSGQFTEQDVDSVNQLYLYLNDVEGSTVEPYTGQISVVNGVSVSAGYTLLNSRSIAEDVVYNIDSEDPYTGMLEVSNGRLVRDNLQVSGKSLVHSAPLTAIAFSRGFFGDWGLYRLNWLTSICVFYCYRMVLLR